MMKNIKLTDYQIAEAFGKTLSRIYKKKIEELYEDLKSIYSHLDKFNNPSYTDIERELARRTIPHWAQEKIKAINHIQKIRNINKKLKKMSNNTHEKLDIVRARSVEIESLYDFKHKGKNVSCPFHPDKSPSMSIRNNIAHCFQCGFHGSSIDFFMKLNSVDFKTAVNQLCS